MAIQYDDYIYRLSSASPVYTIDLPKDLFWNDEFSWSRVDQTADYSLTGSLLIEEGVKQKGRFITLVGKDNMAWITRSMGVTLQNMRDAQGLQMTLKFVDKNNVLNVMFTKTVMFRHFEGALDIKPILDFDQYETGAYYIVNSIKLMEV